MILDFEILSVFSRERYEGNLLGVFLPSSAQPPDSLSADQALAVARELDFSEIVFAWPPVAGRATVRIFSPGRELAFAGHPCLGAADALSRRAGQPFDAVVLETGAGAVPVRRTRAGRGSSGNEFFMDQRPPVFGRKVAAAEAARVLALARSAIDARFDPREVSTGLPHVLVPLRDRASVDACGIDACAYGAWLRDGLPPNILVFAPGAEDADWSVRMFAPGIGIPEDPATGSGAGCLAAWMLESGYAPGDTLRGRIEQGRVMGRASYLSIVAKRTGEGIAVSVGGQVTLVAEGRYRL